MGGVGEVDRKSLRSRQGHTPGSPLVIIGRRGGKNTNMVVDGEGEMGVADNDRAWLISHETEMVV